MPKESRELMLSTENLLQICLDLHMSNNGSSDPLSKETEERYLKILYLANLNWVYYKHNQDFDNAVRVLIYATLREHARSGVAKRED